MACTPPCWFAITLYLQSVALMIPLIGWASFQIASIFGGYILGVLALQIRSIWEAPLFLWYILHATNNKGSTRESKSCTLNSYNF